MIATAGGSGTLSVLRFLQPTKVVHVGETVEWANSDPVTAHTITFGTEPANPIPPSVNVTVDADGARHATVSSPADNVHSSFISAAPQDEVGLPQPPLGFTRFRVTFTKPGVFTTSAPCTTGWESWGGSLFFRKGSSGQFSQELRNGEFWGNAHERDFAENPRN